MVKKILIEINEKLDKQFSPKGKIIFFVLICLAIAAIIFVAISFAKPKHENLADLPAIENVDVEQPAKDVVEEDIIEIEKTEDKIVSLQVAEFGRSDPFLPDSEVVDITKLANPYGDDLLAPPEILVSNSEASQEKKKKISGIMYDKNNPSAIINIDDSDYLVRTGDYINNYKVLSITKDTVTVQLGANVYKARVGEVIQEGEINYNNVYNLENKFGGNSSGHEK